MDEKRLSPHITRISWGRMEVEGLGAGKDWKLYPGGGRAWDWGETGTRHTPGIQPADVEELVENGAEAVILGCGMTSRLQVTEETHRFLGERGIELHVLETTAAVELYNELATTTAVGGLFHTTC